MAPVDRHLAELVRIAQPATAPSPEPIVRF